MFFSVNDIWFRDYCPELEPFVMDKSRRNLSPKYSFLIYHSKKDIKSCGLTLKSNLYVKQDPMGISEISFPPFGYVITIESNKPKYPDDRLCDITYFSEYGYDEVKTVCLKVPILPAYSFIPGDYRSKKEIDSAIQRSHETDFHNQIESALRKASR